jgi:thymidylate synthase (FAD)
MHTQVVAVTQPLIPGVNSPEEFIAYAARVSNPSNQMNTETSNKLLKYCLKNQHFSIFEMAHVVLEVTTTRDIARQILRHHSFRFQEFSQRYSNPTDSLGFENREARLQDHKNRQNSIETHDPELQSQWEQMQKQVQISAESSYNWAIENGIAKEQARAVLPEGLTVSKLYMSGTLRSFIHWIEVRTDPGTQKEHRAIAESARVQILQHCPFLKTIWE